jgi:hypothetical protein
MSLNSGDTTVTANDRANPTVLVNPAAGELWNQVDVSKTAGIAAEISFDGGSNWLPWPADYTDWCGPFPKSTNRVLVRPAPGLTPVTGLLALARRVK